MIHIQNFLIYFHNPWSVNTEQIQKCGKKITNIRCHYLIYILISSKTLKHINHIILIGRIFMFNACHGDSDTYDFLETHSSYYIFEESNKEIVVLL